MPVSLCMHVPWLDLVCGRACATPCHYISCLPDLPRTRLHTWEGVAMCFHSCDSVPSPLSSRKPPYAAACRAFDRESLLPSCLYRLSLPWQNISGSDVASCRPYTCLPLRLLWQALGWCMGGRQEGRRRGGMGLSLSQEEHGWDDIQMFW